MEIDAEEGEQQVGVEYLFLSTAHEIGCSCVGLDDLVLIRTDDHVARRVLYLSILHLYM